MKPFIFVITTHPQTHPSNVRDFFWGFLFGLCLLFILQIHVALCINKSSFLGTKPLVTFQPFLGPLNGNNRCPCLNEMTINVFESKPIECMLKLFFLMLLPSSGRSFYLLWFNNHFLICISLSTTDDFIITCW